MKIQFDFTEEEIRSILIELTLKKYPDLAGSVCSGLNIISETGIRLSTGDSKTTASNFQIEFTDKEDICQ